MRFDKIKVRLYGPALRIIEILRIDLTSGKTAGKIGRLSFLLEKIRPFDTVELSLQETGSGRQKPSQYSRIVYGG